MKKLISLAITAALLFTAASCASTVSDTQQKGSSASGAVEFESSESAVRSSASLITDRSSQEVRDLINKIKSAAGNGKILSTYPDRTVFLGEVDGATETIRIDIEFSDEKTHVKGDRSFSLKPGQNDFSVTIQNDVAEAAVSFVIYRHSEDKDYYAMAKEKYEKAQEFYWRNTQSLALKFDYDTTYKHPDWGDLPLCTNFVEVASQIFTDNGIKQFSESYPFYVCVDNNITLEIPAEAVILLISIRF